MPLHQYKLAQRHTCATCLRLYERHGATIVDGSLVHEELTPGQWLGNRAPVSFQQSPAHAETASPVRISGKEPKQQRKLKPLGGDA